MSRRVWQRQAHGITLRLGPELRWYAEVRGERWAFGRDGRTWCGRRWYGEQVAVKFTRARSLAVAVEVAICLEICGDAAVQPRG